MMVDDIVASITASLTSPVVRQKTFEVDWEDAPGGTEAKTNSVTVPTGHTIVITKSSHVNTYTDAELLNGDAAFVVSGAKRDEYVPIELMKAQDKLLSKPAVFSSGESFYAWFKFGAALAADTTKLRLTALVIHESTTTYTAPMGAEAELITTSTTTTTTEDSDLSGLYDLLD